MRSMSSVYRDNEYVERFRFAGAAGIGTTHSGHKGGLNVDKTDLVGGHCGSGGPFR